ncbi:hypothetical protein H9P43_001505 [Blastocladiella emersonii ATCC 22665]|nr:hypothetical protein H9P43_001505 [Blastocladiella emersonii ATCC 22665]
MKISATRGNDALDPASVLGAASADPAAIAILARGYAVDRFVRDNPRFDPSTSNSPIGWLERVEASLDLAAVPTSYRVECLLGLIDSPDFLAIAKDELLQLDDRSDSMMFERLREFFIATFAPYERHLADVATRHLRSLCPDGRSDAEFYLAFRAALLDIPLGFRMPEAEATSLFIDAVGRDRFPADFDADGWTLPQTYAELCRTTYLAENPQAAEESKEEPKIATNEPVADAQAKPEIAGDAAPVPSTSEADLAESASSTNKAAEEIEDTADVAESSKDAAPAAAVEPIAEQAKPIQPSPSPARSKKARKKKPAAGPPPKSASPPAVAAQRQVTALVSSPSPAAAAKGVPPIAMPTYKSPGPIEWHVPAAGDAPFVVGTINNVLVAARLLPSTQESFISSRIVDRAGLKIDPSETVVLAAPDGPPTASLGVVHVHLVVGRDKIPLRLHVVKDMFWDITYCRDGIASLTVVNGECKLAVRGEHGPVPVMVFKRTEIPPYMFDR